MTESTCPTVSSIREILYSSGDQLDPTALNISSVDDLEAYLSGKGLSVANCDHLAMARLLRDFFLEMTEDDLLAAVGGEKFVAKVVVGGAVAGATAAAVGGGVGAAIAVTGH
jgi:hypothetical protein